MTGIERVIMCVTLTLCVVVVGMVGALIVAIFDPNIPDEPVFAIIGPAFQTVVGGFIGLITGINIGKKDDE